jgi:site-specific DNA-cytosine methylase
MAGKQLGDKDERGMLFWTMLDIMKHVRHYNPKTNFLIENVKMKKEFEEYITHHMTNAIGEVHKTLINSALVSAQNRNRYYWTSFAVSQPEDKKILLADILDPNLPDCPVGVAVRNKSKCVRSGGRNSPFDDKHEWDSPFQRISKKGKVKQGIDKAACLTGGANSGGNHSDMDIIHSPFATRRYSVRECFRLQTVLEHYIDKILACGMSNSQLYKIAGNGWTDEVIAHILRCLK